MRLIRVDTWKLEDFFGDGIPPYAILSHTWGPDSDELSFGDIQDVDVDSNPQHIKFVKLKGCCERAKEDGLQYVWIDTCCINKSDGTELGEAINSMFRWYTKSAVCYAYLADVPPGDPCEKPGSKFYASRWFTRGWTLQELVAPRQFRFYDSSWALIGTKGQLATPIQNITGIPRSFLLGWLGLHEASVAQRMSWAAKRTTKRREDIAYSLLGIFGVMLPMIYGEGDQAFIRLQEAIMKESGDDSILAWELAPEDGSASPATIIGKKSRGAFATSPLAFAHCSNIVARDHHHDDTTAHPLETSGGRLKVHLHVHPTSGGETYGLLSCGPETNLGLVVGVPLSASQSRSSLSDEYIRPHGKPTCLFPMPSSDMQTKAIHIKTDRQSVGHTAANRRHWFCIEEPVGGHLELIDVYPRDSWRKDRAMIATGKHEGDTGEGSIQLYWARFRQKAPRARDFVVAFRFEARSPSVPQSRAGCRVVTCSRDASLEGLLQATPWI